MTKTRSIITRFLEHRSRALFVPRPRVWVNISATPLRGMFYAPLASSAASPNRGLVKPWAFCLRAAGPRGAVQLI